MTRVHLNWIIGLLLFVSVIACKKKDVEEDPLVINVTPEHLVFSSNAGDVVQFNITASSGIPLKKFYITAKKGSSFTQTLKDSSLPVNQKFKYMYEYEVPSGSSDYSVILDFKIIDDTGTEKSTARKIDVKI